MLLVEYVQVGPTAFEVARRYIDDVVSVDEKMIALAMLRLLENERCVKRFRHLLSFT